MRLKRALRRIHARQPWTPKPASDAEEAARVALAWAWRLGAAGSGVAVLGIQKTRHLPVMGRASAVLPGYAA